MLFFEHCFLPDLEPDIRQFGGVPHVLGESVPLQLMIYVEWVVIKPLAIVHIIIPITIQDSRNY